MITEQLIIREIRINVADRQRLFRFRDVKFCGHNATETPINENINLSYFEAKEKTCCVIQYLDTILYNVFV